MSGEKSSSKTVGLALAALLIVSILVVMTVVKYQWLVPGGTDVRAELGQAGDYFGGILNPVFAFFSFIALLYTIILQTNEMTAAREEAVASREEARNSVDALNAQVNHLQKEAIKSDIYRVIDAAQKTIEKVLSKSVEINPHKVVVNPVMIEVRELCTLGSLYFSYLPEKGSDSSFDEHPFIELGYLLNEIVMYIQKYKSISGDKLLAVHFSHRYVEISAGLNNKKYSNNDPYEYFMSIIDDDVNYE